MEYISDIKLSCLVNIFLFQFKVHRCSGFFFSFKSETQESPQFSLGFPDNLKGKVGVWFIIYLMQNVYKFI